VFGGSAKKQLWFEVVPCTTNLVISVTFLPVAIWLLCRSLRHNASDEQKVIMKGLGWRLLGYFVLIFISWSLVVAVQWKFYESRDPLEDGAQARFECYFASEGSDACHKGYRIGLGWYYMMGVAMLGVCSASLMLSCHPKAVRRWIILWRVCTNRVFLCGNEENDILRRLQSAGELDVSAQSSRLKSPRDKSRDNTRSKSPRGTPPDSNGDTITSTPVDMELAVAVPTSSEEHTEQSSQY
jgi:hypothetical protein